MGSDIVAYRHPTAGFGLPLPADWERAEDPQPGVALVAVGPELLGGFRANVVVTVERLPASMDLDGWQADAEGLLAAELSGYLALDRERTRLASGREVLRRLAHHAPPPGLAAVTMEQWTTVERGLGFTLTASAGTLEYDALADLFAGIAEGFEP